MIIITIAKNYNYVIISLVKEIYKYEYIK